MIRILVIDDSIIVRRTLFTLLNKEPDFSVVGTAKNGLEGLEKLAELKPDIVTLDVMMPVLDGLQTLSRLRETDLATPVIMFSSLTESGASATMEALSRGADDFVMKPSQSLNPLTDTTGSIQGQLIPKIRGLAKKTRNKWDTAHGKEPVPYVFRMPRVTARNILERRNNRPDIVAIGVSTGGPEALHKVLPSLPESFSVPVMVVQHMPSLFTRALAERLDKFCKLKVKEAEEGEILEAGTIYLGSGDFHLTVKRDGTKVRAVKTRTPPVNSCRPSVDVLFSSLAGVFGRRTLALVFTGMGKDGLEGCRDLRSAGATIFVQDKKSSVIWGMPGHVARANLANKVISLDRVTYEITRALARPI